MSEIEPADGWWNSETADILAENALVMLEKLDEDVVENILFRIMRAAASEYGE